MGACCSTTTAALARFVHDERQGATWADLVDLAEGVEVEEAVGPIFRKLAGLRVSGTLTLGRALVAAGARPGRHGHVMRHVLTGVPCAWSADALGQLRLTPVDRLASALVAASRAAYPPDHPDFQLGGDVLEEIAASLERLMSGADAGTLLACSRLAVDPAGRVVGAPLVTDLPAQPPFGGPWLVELFRDPRHRGVGAALLRRVIWQAAADAHGPLGLAVTDGNPARGLYEAVGFALVSSFVDVDVP